MFERRCPIPGCNFRFSTRGAQGYTKHITAPRMHPSWYREGESGRDALNRFFEEYPEFFVVGRPARLSQPPPYTVHDFIAAAEGRPVPIAIPPGLLPDRKRTRDELLEALSQVLKQCSALQCDIATMAR